jgi:hypothetical protein
MRMENLWQWENQKKLSKKGSKNLYKWESANKKENRGGRENIKSMLQYDFQLSIRSTYRLSLTRPTITGCANVIHYFVTIRNSQCWITSKFKYLRKWLSTLELRGGSGEKPRISGLLLAELMKAVTQHS